MPTTSHKFVNSNFDCYPTRMHACTMRTFVFKIAQIPNLPTVWQSCSTYFGSEISQEQQGT